MHRVDSVDYAIIFPELFSESLGTLKGVEAILHVDDKVILRCFKPCPVLALRGKVETELNRLQAQGVIIPVEHSNWAVPIVPLSFVESKLGGTHLRGLHVYRDCDHIG